MYSDATASAYTFKSVSYLNLPWSEMVDMVQGSSFLQEYLTEQMIRKRCSVELK